MEFGKSCQRRAAGVRGKLICRDLCSRIHGRKGVQAECCLSGGGGGGVGGFSHDAQVYP